MIEQLAFALHDNMRDMLDDTDLASRLATAMLVAREVHSNQKDLSDEPYILHVLRVSMSGTTDDERVVGLLHDVIEDGTASHADALFALRNIFGDVIADTVDVLTKRKNEKYDAYIERVGAHDLARRVKIYDLKDNTDAKRLNLHNARMRVRTKKDADRVVKYARALVYLRDIERTRLADV